MTGGYVFTGVCPFKVVGRWSGVPNPRSGLGGYPIPGVDRGYPIPGLEGGNPHPRSEWGTLDTPWSRLDGVPLVKPGWVPPLSKTEWDNSPPPRLDGLPPPQPRSMTGWGTPHSRLDGVPSSIRRQISKASTCYAAGGAPLAFTQEDFLVHNKFVQLINTAMY